MRDELGADEDEEGEGEWGEGALPREERAPPTVGDSAAAPRDSSRSAAPAASRSGLVMLGLVQLALTSPFASFETLVTPFTEVSTINKDRYIIGIYLELYTSDIAISCIHTHISSLHIYQI